MTKLLGVLGVNGSPNPTDAWNDRYDLQVETIMAKRKIDVRMRSCGIYTHWDAESKALPRFQEAAHRIRAEVGVEFGLVVDIRGAKNELLTYCIDHPGILDEDGNRRSPFEGTVYVKQNDWKFFLGDTIWEPIADKLGDWRLTLELDGKIVADETFNLYLDD